MMIIVYLLGSLVVVIGALIVFLIYMSRRINKVSGGAAKAPARPVPPAASPSKLLDIVKERYAKGEITREQFEQLTKDLS